MKPHAKLPLPEDIKELIGLVREGKLFAVQKWIAEGKRTFSPESYHNTPIEVALRSGFHSLVEVLLKAVVEQKIKDDLLTSALRYQKYYMIELLVEHGADVRKVDFAEVCSTYNPAIMKFFLDRGADAVTGQPFARALKHAQRPHLGIYLGYRDKIPELEHQLNLALRYHVKEGKLKWVCLLLWAGANPRIALPDIGEGADSFLQSSALEEAVRGGHLEMVEKMKIDPKVDDLNLLLAWACTTTNWGMIQKILDLGADPNATSGEGAIPMNGLMCQLVRKIYPYFGFRQDYEVNKMVEIITQFADRGGRWHPADKYSMNNLRWALYKLNSGELESILLKFHHHSAGPKEVLLRLINTPQMKKKLGEEFTKLKQVIDQQIRLPARNPRKYSLQGYRI